MFTISIQDNKKKASNSIKSEFTKYLVDKNQITEYQTRTWFKGSRYR